MYKDSLDIYDELPEDMIEYLKYNGRHFNKHLCDFAVSQMEDSNGKITGISLTYNDIPDNYSSLYAPFGFYGWPLTASDIQSLANLSVGQGSQYDVYWSKDVSSPSNKPAFPGVGVQMTPDLKALLDDNDQSI